MWTQKRDFSLYITSVTQALLHVCIHFLNMRDIILIGDNIIMLLS